MEHDESAFVPRYHATVRAGLWLVFEQGNYFGNYGGNSLRWHYDCISKVKKCLKYFLIMEKLYCKSELVQWFLIHALLMHLSAESALSSQGFSRNFLNNQIHKKRVKSCTFWSPILTRIAKKAKLASKNIPIVARTRARSRRASVTIYDSCSGNWQQLGIRIVNRSREIKP